MAISPQQIVGFTSCLVLGWGFWGRRIEWRNFHFYKIQDGGWAAILENSNSKISNGDISARDHPIYFTFGSRVALSGSADQMALSYWAARHDATGDSPNMLFLGRETSTPLDLVMGLPLDQRLTCVGYDNFVQLVERRATEANGVARKHLHVRTPIVVRILTESAFDSNNFMLETGCGITARDVTV